MIDPKPVRREVRAVPGGDRPGGRPADRPMTSLLAGVKVINIGLVGFADALWAQGVPCVHVDWAPSAANDKETENLLELLL